VSQVSVASISTYLKQKETRKISPLDLSKNNRDVAGKSILRFVSFAGAVPRPLPRSQLPSLFLRVQKEPTKRGNTRRGFAAGDARARLTPPPRSMAGEISICDSRSRDKSRSGHEATINRAPPVIRLCAIRRNARRARKLRSGIHRVRFASFRAGLRGGSRSMEETRQAPRLAIRSMFRVSHEYSAFNGRVALVTLKSRVARFRHSACQPSSRLSLDSFKCPFANREIHQK